jgi:hypothetical protein
LVQVMKGGFEVGKIKGILVQTPERSKKEIIEV